MFVVAPGTGMPTPITRAQKSSAWHVELGNGDISPFDAGTGSAENENLIALWAASGTATFHLHCRSDRRACDEESVDLSMQVSIFVCTTSRASPESHMTGSDHNLKIRTRISMSFVKTFPTVAALIIGMSLTVVPQDNDKPAALSADEQAIVKTAEAFVEAFNQADAKAVAALWTEDGEMSVDRENIATGRSEVESSYADFFVENPGVQISLHIESVRRLGRNMIVEKGVSEIINDESDDVVDSYTLVHVKQGEQWLIATADVQHTEVDNFDWKAALGFLEGKWKAEEDDWRVETEFEWVSGGNFLKRTFAVYAGDEQQSSGVQVIGWDPLEQSVTSWTFGADGGNGRGWWVLDGDQWEITAEGVTAGGEVVTATNVVTIVDDDTFRWQSTDRSISGYALEPTDSVRVSRVKLDK